MYSGAITALVTPMRDGRIDEAGLRELVEFQIGEGIDGLVPCGTTGEAPTLSQDEQALVIRVVVSQAKKRVPVIAGAGANATHHAVQLSKLAAECGADALLHVVPYYNKPSQSGLISHFRAIEAAVGLPIVLYNVPGRTGCDLLPETAAELAQSAQIVALKEATGSIVRGQQVLAACERRGVSLALLSGDDATAMALTAIGGSGVISVTSNVVPRKMSELIRLTRNAELARARALQYELLRLMDLMFCESNPIPVKAAVSLMGLAANEIRLPLEPLAGAKLDTLREELTHLGLIR